MSTNTNRYFIRLSNLNRSTQFDDLKEFFRRGRITVCNLIRYGNSDEEAAVDTKVAILELQLDSVESLDTVISQVNGKTVYRDGNELIASAAYFCCIDNLDRRGEENDVIAFLQRGKVNVVECRFLKDRHGIFSGSAEVEFSDLRSLETAISKVTGKRIYKNGNIVNVRLADPEQHVPAAEPTFPPHIEPPPMTPTEPTHPQTAEVVMHTDLSPVNPTSASIESKDDRTEQGGTQSCSQNFAPVGDLVPAGSAPSLMDVLVLPSNASDTYDVKAEILLKLAASVSITRDHGCSAESLLRGLIDIVGATAKGMLGLKASSAAAVYAVGRTGVGKSTFLAYLLGHQLEKVKLGNYKSVWQYRDVPAVPHPIIGSGGSETKGCHFYSHRGGSIDYVDCAGTMDSGGPDQDISNAASLAIAMRERPLSNLLVLIKTSDITENRGVAFLGLVKKLSRCIRLDDFEDAWRRFVCVVNDKVTDDEGEIVTREEGKLFLSACLHGLAQSESHEINKILFAYGSQAVVSQSLESSASFPRQDATPEHDPDNSVWTSILKGIPADKRQAIEEKQFSIRFIKWLEEHPEHLMIAEVGDRCATRDAVERLIASSGSPVPPGGFAPQCFYEDTVRDPVEAVDEVITGVVESVVAKINEFNEHLEAVTALQSDLDCQRRAKNQLSAIIKMLSKYIEDEKQKQAVYDEELRGLQGDECPALLISVKPDSAIEPRSFFGFTAFATKYSFNFSTHLLSSQERDVGPVHAPIEKVEEVRGSMGMATGSSSSSFSEHNSDLANGSYSAKYLPAYYGFLEDKDTVVRIFIKKCHLPATLWKIKSLNDKKKVSLSTEAALEMRLQTYRGDNTQDEAEITARLQQLGEEMEEKTQAALALLRELLDYRPVCLSVARSMHFLCKPGLVVGGAGPALHPDAVALFSSIMAQLDCGPAGALCSQGHVLFPAFAVLAESRSRSRSSDGGVGVGGGSSSGGGGGAAASAGGMDSRAGATMWRCTRCASTMGLNGWACLGCSESVCYGCVGGGSAGGSGSGEC